MREIGMMQDRRKSCSDKDPFLFRKGDMLPGIPLVLCNFLSLFTAEYCHLVPLLDLVTAQSIITCGCFFFSFFSGGGSIGVEENLERPWFKPNVSALSGTQDLRCVVLCCVSALVLFL